MKEFLQEKGLNFYQIKKKEKLCRERITKRENKFKVKIKCEEHVKS